MEDITDIIKALNYQREHGFNRDAYNLRNEGLLKSLIGRQGVNAVESAGYAGSGFMQGHKERFGSLADAYGVDIPASKLLLGVDEKAIMEGGEQVGTEWDYAKSPERALLLAKGDNIRLQKALDELQLQQLIEELKTPQGPINQEIRKSDAKII